jgi:hypothetical protein
MSSDPCSMKKESSGIVVLVPEDRAIRFHGREIITIELGDLPRRPVLVESGEHFEVDSMAHFVACGDGCIATWRARTSRTINQVETGKDTVRDP